MAKRVNTIEAKLKDLKELQAKLNTAKVNKDVALENERIALEKAEDQKGEYLIAGDLDKYLESCNVVDYHKGRIENIKSEAGGKISEDDIRQIKGLYDSIASAASKEAEEAVKSILQAVTEVVEKYDVIIDEAYDTADQIIQANTNKTGYDYMYFKPRGTSPSAPAWYRSTLNLLRDLGMLNR